MQIHDGILYLCGPKVRDREDVLLFLKNLEELSSIEIIIPLTVTFDQEGIPRVEEAWLGWGKPEDSLPLYLQDVFGLSIISKIEMLEVTSPAPLWSAGAWDQPLFLDEPAEGMHSWAPRFFYSQAPDGLEELFAEERVMFRQQTEIWMEAPPSVPNVVSGQEEMQEETLLCFKGRLETGRAGKYTFILSDGTKTAIVVKNPAILLEEYSGTEITLLATAEKKNGWILKIYGINSDFIQ